MFIDIVIKKKDQQCWPSKIKQINWEKGNLLILKILIYIKLN